MRPRLDVAVYAPRAWPLYTEPPGASFGGAEVQATYLAQALARLGLRVGHVVFAHPGVPDRRHGVELVRADPPDPRANRVGHARRVFATLARTGAAVFVHRSAGPDAGLIGGYSKARRRAFILSTSWDGDLVAPPIDRLAARSLYRAGVRMADAIVVQTRDQRDASARSLQRRMRVIRSFAETAADAGRERSGFLWVGRIVDYKDPLAYADLAARVPGARFWMVADMSTDADAELNRRVRDTAAMTPNLELVAPRPREQLFELYERAVAVVNTSLVEGFPNTFMEGWARGAPALSLRLDPDGVIGGESLGFCASGSLEELADAARTLWESRRDPALGDRARAYISRRHSLETVGGQWLELVEELLRRPLGVEPVARAPHPGRVSADSHRGETGK